MRKQLPILTAILLSSICVSAQVDTLNTSNGRMNMKAFKPQKASYAVFWTDSMGNHITSADLWEREVTINNSKGHKLLYVFYWKMWRKDTMVADVTSIGNASTLSPISHEADYKSRGKFRYEFADGKVTIPDSFKKNAKDSAYNLKLDPPGFAFPMDLEILPLVPMKKVGQEFAIAFYEPGSAKSNYYKLTVVGKEDVLLPGNAKLNCWMLRIDYGQQGSYATFWIADGSVVKMKEFFRGRYRNKVRLY